jgi:multidrug resistance efflux pump
MILRASSGILLSLAGAYVVVGEHLAGVSSDATVNAPVLVVRAPIDGELRLRGHPVGSFISAGEAIGSVRDDRVDPGRLLELQRSEAALQSEVTRLEALLAAAHAAREMFGKEAERYRRGRQQQLERRLAEANAALLAAQARARELEAALKRALELGERGVQTAAGIERARSAFEIAEQEWKSARERVSYVGIEMVAAAEGTYLGDSYNDAPFSLQRLRDLDQRSAELAAELAHAHKRLAQTAEQISDERARLAGLSSAELNAPTAGILWDYLASTGEVVRKGQDLLRLVDCAGVMVTAGVSERLYNSLKPGDRARFRLRGTVGFTQQRSPA